MKVTRSLPPPRRPAKQLGYTLIELWTVMAVIGILAIIALATYQAYQSRARVAEALAIADRLRLHIVEFHASRGVFPANNAEAGMDPPDSYATKNIKSVTIMADGTINIAIQDVIQPGAALGFKPFANAGAYIWDCTAANGVTTLIQGLRPPVCR